MLKSSPRSGARPKTAPAAAPKSKGDRTDTNSVDDRLFVVSVEKAMKVLETFDKQSRELAMFDIVSRTGMGRSATQRFVYTLEHLGYLKRNSTTRQYSLSPKVFRFAHNALMANVALEQANHVLAKLGADIGETVSWVELDRDDIVILGNVPSVHLTSINLPVGTLFPALTSSSGQVLLSNAEPIRAVGMFKRAPDAVRSRLGVQTEIELLQILERVRRAGYSMTEKNLGQGSLSMSAPVFDYSGRAIAAINISTLTTRFTRDSARKTLIPKLLEAAKEASRAVSHSS